MSGAEHATGRTSRSRRRHEPPAPHALRSDSEATIRIEAHTRWDALDLTRRLPICNWFLVARDRERWEVCVRTDQHGQELILELIDVAQAWADGRDLDSVVHLPDRDLPLHRARSDERPTP